MIRRIAVQPTRGIVYEGDAEVMEHELELSRLIGFWAEVRFVGPVRCRLATYEELQGFDPGDKVVPK